MFSNDLKRIGNELSAFSLSSSSLSLPDLYRHAQHKLLRQKRWHVPVPPKAQNSQQMNSILPRLSSALSIFPSLSTSSPTEPQVPESALDIEFENAWETTSDWNEDDDEACNEENGLCFGRDPLPASEPPQRRPERYATAPSSYPTPSIDPPRAPSAFSSYSYPQGVDNNPSTQSTTPPAHNAGSTSGAPAPSETFMFTGAPPFQNRSHSNPSPGYGQNNGASFGFTSTNATSYNASTSSPGYARAYAQSYGNQQSRTSSSYNAPYRSGTQNGDASYQSHSQTFGTSSHSWPSGRGY